jgi:PIN domain nuclease of toxin-antitoxin system
LSSTRTLLFGFIWYVNASPRLSDKVRRAMDDATAVDAPLMISAVTLVKLVYRMEKGTFHASEC